MRRYAAFLRGVSPMNARMPDLRAAFESAGFVEVTTRLSSGNLVFSALAASEAALQRRAEAAMTERLGHAFLTIVRSVDGLHRMLLSDPYRGFRLRPGTKRVVTFLRRPPAATPVLPIVLRGVRILALAGRQVFSAYVPDSWGPDFMTLIEKTFGKEVTTRTWETVAKVASAGGRGGGGGS